MKASIEVEVTRRADGTFDVWWPTGDVTDQVPAEWLERHGIPVPAAEPVVPFNEAAERARQAREELRRGREDER